MKQHSIDAILSIRQPKERPIGEDLAFVKIAFDSVIRQSNLLILNTAQREVLARAILVAFRKEHDMDSLVAAGHCALNIYAK